MSESELPTTEKPPCRDTPCPSCPFLEGNDEQFGEIVKKLRKSFGFETTHKFDILYARRSVTEEAIEHRTLLCHCSVYDADMKTSYENPQQCAGLRQYLEENPQPEPETE